MALRVESPALAGRLAPTAFAAGRPKDGDPRACWALVDTTARSVEFRRVEYNVERTARAILASDLPHEFAAQVREARGYAPPVIAG